MMNDLISRQAAIDAISTWDKFGVDERGRLVRWHEGLVLYVHLRDVLTAIVNLPSAQPDVTAINKFIDGLEEIFADIRERNVDDSVCGLCEFDGAYVGESGDWCNECPGFNRDDCFKLRDRIREKWIAKITNAASSVQPEREHTMEEFMFGQDTGNPEDGSL